MTRARLTFLMLFALLVSCTRPTQPPPRPLKVIPGTAPSATAVKIRIEGEGLSPAVETDFGSKEKSVVDARFTAQLGELALTDVSLGEDGALTATVPAGLPLGVHELRVTNARGQMGTLPSAYRVVSSLESVGSFLFEPIGPQREGVPFAVGVAAVDAQGRVVEGFSGSVQLTAATGAVTPVQLGPFVLGRLRGAQVTVTGTTSAQRLTALDGAGHSGTSEAFDVAVGPPQALTLSGPGSALAGDCTGPFTVSVIDSGGNLVPTLAVSLDAAPPEGVELFKDAACSQPLSGGPLFYARLTLATAVTLRAKAAELPSTTTVVQVLAGAPSQLQFLTPSRVVSVGACSPQVSLRAVDGFGNPALVLAVTPLSLSVAGDGGVSAFANGEGSAFADSSCATPAALSLSQSATATVHFTAPRTGSFDLSVSAVGLTAATQRQTVQP